jgi:polyisoprenoid-binding protein YceI
VTTLTGTLVPPGTWRIDPSRSSVGFAVRHLKVLHVRGRFRAFDGRVACHEDGVVSVLGAVAVASIDTGDERRDERLRTHAFFDVARHPTFEFEGSCEPGDRVLRGTLAIRGLERPIALRLEPPTRVNGDLRLRATGAVSRREFGLDWDPAFAAGGLAIGDRVDIRLDVVVSRRA